MTKKHDCWADPADWIQSGWYKLKTHRVNDAGVNAG